MSTKTKQLIFNIVWFLMYILTVQFFRFKFGLLKIAAVYIVVGALLHWLVFRKCEKREHEP